MPTVANRQTNAIVVSPVGGIAVHATQIVIVEVANIAKIWRVIIK